METTQIVIKMMGALGIVLGGLLIALYFLKRIGKNFNKGTEGMIEVVAAKMILPKKHIVIVKVGSRKFVVGASENGLNLLASLEGEECGTTQAPK